MPGFRFGIKEVGGAYIFGPSQPTVARVEIEPFDLADTDEGFPVATDGPGSSLSLGLLQMVFSADLRLDFLSEDGSDCRFSPDLSGWRSR